MPKFLRKSLRYAPLKEGMEIIEKKRQHQKPIPETKKCRCCGEKRVKHHHWLCDKCWNERYLKDNKPEVTVF